MSITEVRRVDKTQMLAKRIVLRIAGPKAIRLATIILVVAGSWTFPFPSAAQTPNSMSNDQRNCAARLLTAGLAAAAVAKSCTEAPRPTDLAICVTTITKNNVTSINPTDALASCTKAKQPRDLATCIVDISKNLQVPELSSTVLDYCGRSLLPVTFAKCVVGLRQEIQLAPMQALDTCIDGSDRQNQVPMPPQ